MVHPAMHQALVKYHSKVPAGARPGVLTDGAATRKADIQRQMLCIIDDIKKTVANPFVQEYASLAHIRPEMGEFSTPEQLGSLITSMKNDYSELLRKVNQSGRNEHGVIEPQSVLQFCRNGRVVNLGESFS